MNKYDKYDQDNHQDVGCAIVTIIILLGLLIAVLLDPAPEDLSGISDRCGTACAVVLVLAAVAAWARERMRRK
jgi:di/tricarboxylate transporter